MWDFSYCPTPLPLAPPEGLSRGAGLGPAGREGGRAWGPQAPSLMSVIRAGMAVWPALPAAQWKNKPKAKRNKTKQSKVVLRAVEADGLQFRY